MNNLLDIKKLTIHYETTDGLVKAVNGVSLSVKEGKFIGLVGETGAGKTTLAKGIMRLISKPSGKIREGEIIYNGRNLLTLSDSEMRKIRGKEISMIFQDPMTSLNPVMKVGDQIAEAISNHEKMSTRDAFRKAMDMLELVGIHAERSGEYPHQFSGGMKQRVVIAMGLACNPKLLIADEPTTALDVTIQAQVLEMMHKLRNKLNTAMILITHDLGLVAQNCEYVAIIYAGEIVESGTVRDVFHNKKHPYTQGLFTSIPNIAAKVNRLIPIEGLMPDSTNLPKGCKFSDRCKFVFARCKEELPQLRLLGGEENSHMVKCFLCEVLSEKEV